MFITRVNSKTGERTTVERVNIIGTATRNGSYIDLHFVRNGKVDWIGIDLTDLKRIVLGLVEHGDHDAIRLTFDETPTT